ncbi:MAG TPA: glycosyltransferase family A protein [Anaerolineae bacterium]|nr:glycosyltransferase family A protein [Anaerolineae bacterium]
MTDLVVTTCERLPLLTRTLEYIWERTVSPYRLHVIDDASTTGNAQYLRELLVAGKVDSVHLHTERMGVPSHLRAMLRITMSDPIVFVDDDILCPKLEPDWLAQGLEAMERYPDVWLLALNLPQANIGDRRHWRERREGVTLCVNVGGTFVFARRAALEPALLPADGTGSAIRWLCLNVGAAGGKVGYLTDVYCQHIGAISARNGKDMSRELAKVSPINPDMLEPPDEYKG